MFAIKSDILLFFIFIHVSNCQRRIEHGKETKADKPYVVYLVKAPNSENGYDFWLCGGALVTSDFVVTSAACIKDVEYLYVVAGYKKYITDEEIETDPCTSKMKKKVIYTCYPEGYELRYERLDKWSLIDIGVVKVESPFDFEDQSFKTLCSYIPGVIPIGYDAKYQEPGTDGAVYGWGHLTAWRKPEDRANYNQATLQYAPVLIIDKEECKSHYEEYGKMIDVIDTYMICTLGHGQINEYGEPIEPPGQNDEKIFLYGCTKRKSWPNNQGDPVEDCEEYDEGDEYDETRRDINVSNSSIIKTRKIKNKVASRAEINITSEYKRTNRTRLIKATVNGTSLIKRTLTLSNKTVSFKKPSMSNKTGDFNETLRDSRRYGICQNDHGGPLVTWVGAHEVLIGVASVFKVADDYKCIGPYLFTSTQCSGAFLDCILTKSNFNPDVWGRGGTSDNRHRKSYCKKSEDDEKHPTIERHISWLLHPAGPADHERHLKKEPEAKDRGKNEEIVKQSAMSGKLVNAENPQSERHPSNKKSGINVNNAPNKFQANDNVQNNPRNNENTGPSDTYVANEQHGPVARPVMTNDIPKKLLVSNNGPARESLKRFEQSYKPKSTFVHVQKNEAIPKELARNLGPASHNMPALNNMPASNNVPELNNMPASNNLPELNNMPASNNRPQNMHEALKLMEMIQSNAAMLPRRLQNPHHIGKVV